MIQIMRSTADDLILPRFKNLNHADIFEKTGPKDLVTIADLESERQMAILLKNLINGSLVIGEEGISKEPKLIELLCSDSAIWVIDPVDGTNNFAKGKRYFCVMVALVYKQEIQLGVILDPLGRKWAAAERGGGAWLGNYDTSYERRLSVNSEKPLTEMLGVLNFRFLDSGLKEKMRQRARRSLKRFYSHGCAGHEYLELVTNESQFTMYVKNMPWDHAAGSLIFTESGGYHARFDGRQYDPRELNGGLLAAPNKCYWEQLHAVLFNE